MASSTNESVSQHLAILNGVIYSSLLLLKIKRKLSNPGIFLNLFQRGYISIFQTKVIEIIAGIS